MIISYYLAKKFLKLFSAILCSIIILTYLIDFIELTNNYGDKNISTLTIMYISLLKQPILILEILPFLILLTSILFFAKLSNNSEITILKSAGHSSKKIFLIPILLILLINSFELLPLQILASKSKASYNELLKQTSSKQQTAQQKNKIIWLKQDNQQPPYILKSSYPTKNIFPNPVIIPLNQNLNIIYANEAQIRDKKLHFKNAYTIENGKKIPLDSNFVLNTNLTNKEFKKKSSYNIEHPSIIKLIQNIKLLKQENLNYNQQIITLNHQLSKILFYIFLLLLAAYLCIYPPRYHKRILNIINCIIIGFISFFFLNIMYSLVNAGNLNILYGLWMPNILLLISIIYLLIKKELGYGTS